MEFSREAYRKLEEKFADRVEQDKKDFGFKSIFLPNIEPAGPVDYVFVGMEPSFGAKMYENDEETRKFIENGYRNYCGVQILHFPIQEYLCRDDETYYLTDIAQGVIPPGKPGAGDKRKYKAWYPLLKEEVELVAKPDAKVISIGRGVGRFLSNKGLNGHVGSILHYSNQAARWRGKQIPGRKADFEEFAAGLSKWPDGKPMSHSQKKLMFDYKVFFERIRESGLSRDS